jgi:hypothetical protein
MNQIPQSPIPPTNTPSTANTPENSTNEIPPAKPRKLLKKILITLSISILSIIILTGIGTYFLAKQLLPSATNPNEPQDAAKILNNPVVKKMIQTAPIPKVTMIPITVTLSPTLVTSGTESANALPTSWKTYQNASYKFSINYPGNDTYQENNHGLGVIDVVFFDTTQGSSADSPDYQFLLFPKSIGSLIGQDFDALFNLPNPSAQILKINNTSQQFTKLQNTTINGLRAFTFQSTSYPPVADEEPQVGDYIEMGDNILTISAGQSNQATLNSMSASFKYTP